jgi:hypothetical protein
MHGKEESTKEAFKFEGHETLPLKCAIQSLNILNAYPQVEEKQKRKGTKEEVINKDIPWAYFDGASQGNPPKGGSEGSCISPQITI